MSELSEEAENFIGEIEEVCRRHKICMSRGPYGELELWRSREDRDFLEFRRIDDLLMVGRPRNQE